MSLALSNDTDYGFASGGGEHKDLCHSTDRRTACVRLFLLDVHKQNFGQENLIATFEVMTNLRRSLGSTGKI